MQRKNPFKPSANAKASKRNIFGTSGASAFFVLKEQERLEKEKLKKDADIQKLFAEQLERTAQIKTLTVASEVRHD